MLLHVLRTHQPVYTLACNCTPRTGAANYQPRPQPILPGARTEAESTTQHRKRPARHRPFDRRLQRYICHTVCKPDSVTRSPRIRRSRFYRLDPELGNDTPFLNRTFTGDPTEKAVHGNAHPDPPQAQDLHAFKPGELDYFLDYHCRKPCRALLRGNESSHPQRLFSNRNQLQKCNHRLADCTNGIHEQDSHNRDDSGKRRKREPAGAIYQAQE